MTAAGKRVVGDVAFGPTNTSILELHAIPNLTPHLMVRDLLSERHFYKDMVKILQSRPIIALGRICTKAHIASRHQWFSVSNYASGCYNFVHLTTRIEEL